jgi:hypothetical protein
MNHVILLKRVKEGVGPGGVSLEDSLLSDVATQDGLERDNVTVPPELPELGSCEGPSGPHDESPDGQGG